MEEVGCMGRNELILFRVRSCRRRLWTWAIVSQMVRQSKKFATCSKLQIKVQTKKISKQNFNRLCLEG
jgi:hypothetical protein